MDTLKCWELLPRQGIIKFLQQWDKQRGPLLMACPPSLPPPPPPSPLSFWLIALLSRPHLEICRRAAKVTPITPFLASCLCSSPWLNWRLFNPFTWWLERSDRPGLPASSQILKTVKFIFPIPSCFEFSYSWVEPKSCKCVDNRQFQAYSGKGESRSPPLKKVIFYTLDGVHRFCHGWALFPAAINTIKGLLENSTMYHLDGCLVASHLAVKMAMAMSLRVANLFPCSMKCEITFTCDGRIWQHVLRRVAARVMGRTRTGTFVANHSGAWSMGEGHLTPALWAGVPIWDKS